MEQYFVLNGSPHEKLAKHEGIFTRSYQRVKAVFEAKKKSWVIEIRDNLFYVTDLSGKTESVYYDPVIKNCSCEEFVSIQSGTCPHIEAINRLDLPKYKLNKVRPIVFLNELYKTQKIGSGDKPFLTPSIQPFLKMLQKQTLSFDTRELSDLNPFTSYGINLFDYQKDSIKSMIRNKKTVLVLKMGLGKTLCALGCCKILDKNKIIIVCPNNLKFQWRNEINRFNLGSSFIVTKGSDIPLYRGEKFLIISYEMLNFHPEVLNEEFDIAITDEIQKIRNVESVSWSTLSNLKAEYVFALSATPVENNLSDLISLITFLNPFEIKPEWKFYEEFCDYTKAKLYGVRSEKMADLKIKFERYIVNPKVDYSKFRFPKPKHHLIKVTLTPEQEDLHNEYLGAAMPLIAKSINYPLTIGEKNVLNGLLTKAKMAVTDARLLAKDAKESNRIKKIQEIIKNITDQDKKVVVYSEWIKSLNLLKPFLDQYNIKYACFNGDLSSKTRDSEFRRFLEDPATKVFLSTDSGGLGVDGLQFVSHHVIHIERCWNPHKIKQRNGRLIRNLQKSDTVDIYEFTSESSIEMMIDDAAERKTLIVANLFH